MHLYMIALSRKKTYTNGTKGEQTKSVSRCIISLGSLSQLNWSVLRPLLSRRRNFLENKESPNLSLKSEELSGLDRKQGRVGKYPENFFKAVGLNVFKCFDEV